jgi:hypothetical protein
MYCFLIIHYPTLFYKVNIDRGLWGLMHEKQVVAKSPFFPFYYIYIIFSFFINLKKKMGF